MKSLQNSFWAGLFFSLAFVILIMSLPHDTLRYTGVENDFGHLYVAPAMTTNGDTLHQARDFVQAFHGPVYAQLLAWGQQIAEPGTIHGYFTAGKWISAVSGGLILLLIFIWFRSPLGLMTSILLVLTPVFTLYAFTCGSTMIGLTFLLWALYLVYLRRFWLVAGVLLALAIDVRHEYLIVLPFVIYYAWRGRRNLLMQSYFGLRKVSSEISIWKFFQALWMNYNQIFAVVIPFLLFVAPDFPNWDRSYSPALKYAGYGVRHDFFPEYAYTDYYTDDVEQCYMGYLVEMAREKYPTIFHVFWQHPSAIGLVFSEFFMCLGDVVGGLIHPFLMAICILYFLFGKITWRRFTMPLMILGVHFILVSLYTRMMDHYYMLEIVGITMICSVVIWHLFKDKLIWLCLFIPFLIFGGMQTVGGIKQEISYNSDFYLEYRDFARKSNIDTTWVQIDLVEDDHWMPSLIVARYHPERPKILARNAEMPLTVEAYWHEWPKGLRNLYTYCLKNDIDYVWYGGHEKYYRESWDEKLRDPESALPEFEAVKATNYGILYKVMPDTTKG